MEYRNGSGHNGTHTCVCVCVCMCVCVFVWRLGGGEYYFRKHMLEGSGTLRKACSGLPLRTPSYTHVCMAPESVDMKTQAVSENTVGLCKIFPSSYHSEGDMEAED